MARPQRNNVDYFPFICDEGNKMFFIEQQYGNDGFATWVKLLRELAKTDFHYLDLSKKTTSMFLSAKCKVSIEILESIINDLVDLEKFDKELWIENKIIWCQDFIDSIQDAYAKRTNVCIDRKSLLQLLISKGIRKPPISIRKPPISTLKGDVNPQSIVEYSIEEENKVESIDAPIFINPQSQNSNLFKKPKIPTFEEVHYYFRQNGGTEEMAKKFFDTNNAVEWFYKGSPITNYQSMVYGYIESWKKNEAKNKSFNKTEKPSLLEKQKSAYEITMEQLKKQQEHEASINRTN